MFSTSCGGSIKLERKSKSFPHLTGFLALATLPVFLSTIAYVRSPISPRSVTYEELSSSPSIDFTGYRHMETIVPLIVTSYDLCTRYNLLFMICVVNCKVGRSIVKGCLDCL